MSVFKVKKEEADKFAEVWNYNGVTMILDNTAKQFATDFANVVLNNFINMCQANAKAEAAQQAAKAAELNKPKIILEGIR